MHSSWNLFHYELSLFEDLVGLRYEYFCLSHTLLLFTIRYSLLAMKYCMKDIDLCMFMDIYYCRGLIRLDNINRILSIEIRSMFEEIRCH